VPDRPETPLGGALALMERLARDPTVDVDKYERILAMQERLIAKDAEAQFNDAMNRVAQRMAAVRFIRNRSVGYDADKHDKSKGQVEAFRYVPLQDIDKEMRQILIDEQITLRDTNEVAGDGLRIIITRATHRAGHWAEARFPAPLDTTGGKSNVQAMGSTNSYGRRYNRIGLFNLVMLDDDDGTGGFVDDAQLANLRELIGQVQAQNPKSNESAFCKLMKITTLGELPYRRYPAAVSVLNERIQKAEAANSG
jgi:hypothetical protein